MQVDIFIPRTFVPITPASNVDYSLEHQALPVTDCREAAGKRRVFFCCRLTQVHRGAKEQYNAHRLPAAPRQSVTA